MFIRLENCLHCDAPILERRRFRFCSLLCEDEHQRDKTPSIQRINSLQLLEDAAGAWTRIENSSLYLLASVPRRVVIVERIALTRTKIFYRITPAGRRLLSYWKARMGVSA
jgi:hypothetical protein